MWFPYISGARDSFPGVRITIRTKEETEQFNALIDSGADLCFIDEEIAARLRLPRGKKREIGTGGGDAKGTDTQFSFSIKGKKNSLHTVDAVILPRLGHPIILGRKGFFDKYLVTIDDAHKRIRLTAQY